MTDTLNNQTIQARNTLLNIIKELILRSDKYGISPPKFNTLTKAYYTLEDYPNRNITGYIDISSNTHLPGGTLDYSSFTINEKGFEIYNGFVSYEDGECDNSSWEKIFTTEDTEHRHTLNDVLKCWAESFLLHLDENPQRSLLIIDKSIKL